MSPSIINAFTGDGKGKSTSAFGLVMRAHGQGLRVLVVQFLKGEEACNYGEVKVCNTLGIKVLQTGSNRVVLEKNKTDKDMIEAEMGWVALLWEMGTATYDLVIIDELLPVLQLGLLDFDMVYKWLKEQRKGNCEIVVTGRMYDKVKTRKIKDICELYSKIVCINHPFNRKCPDCLVEYNFRYFYCPECGKELVEGKRARLGIEY